MSYLSPDAQARNLEAYFIGRNDLINRWGNILSSWSFLPGTVGFWSMASVNRSTSVVLDSSNQNRTLTPSGNPTFNIFNSFIPHIRYDGTGDYLSRASETGLQITATETHNVAAIRGLSMGCWVRFGNAPGSVERIIAKWNVAGNQKSYSIHRNATGNIVLNISDDGANVFITTGTEIIPTNRWCFVWVTFDPSTSGNVYTGYWDTSSPKQMVYTKTSNTSSVPASIFSGTSDLVLGANGAFGEIMTGNQTLVHISANLFDDSLIQALLEQSSILFLSG